MDSLLYRAERVKVSSARAMARVGGLWNSQESDEWEREP